MNHTNTAARVLALDLATTCGHALLASGVITSGSQSFHSRPRKGVTIYPGEQFARFENWLKERLRDDKPEAIAYEEVFRWMSSSAAHVFCGFRAIMLNHAVRQGVPVFAYSPTTIKKWFTDKGNADKAAMMREAARRWPDLDATDDNEVDALAILHLHLSTIKPTK